MGIHYDYKSTRGEKAMRKEAKRKARLEQKKAKRNLKSKNEEPERYDARYTKNYNFGRFNKS